MIHPFFEYSYVINLDRRPDRLERVTKQLADVDIPVTRIPGFDWPLYPSEADKATHQMIIRTAQVAGLDHVVIFEDDAFFKNDPKNVILAALRELPEDWDMFYLGGNVDAPCKRISPHLAKLSHCQSTHAYAIRHTLYHYFKEDVGGVYLDLFYAKQIVPFHNCFITIPMVAIQAPGWSDIEKMEVNYESWMEERFWTNLRRG